MKVCIEIEPDPCIHWDYDKGEANYTCLPCSCLKNGNNLHNIHYGLMVDGNRYCMLHHNISTAMIEPVAED